MLCHGYDLYDRCCLTHFGLSMIKLIVIPVSVLTSKIFLGTMFSIEYLTIIAENNKIKVYCL